METNTDRTTAAEARFVEEGHRAVLARDERGPYLRVVSETLGHRGIAYKVRAATSGPGHLVAFSCEPDGDVGGDGHPRLARVDGRPPCKHAAGAARRLAREGYATPLLPGIYGDIVTRDTRWQATRDLVWAPEPEVSEAYRTAAEGPGGDPFAGLGR